jgi:phosphoribosylformylglycinamidine synthase
MKQADKTEMTEIRIYQCLWKNMLWAVGCFAFAAGGYLIVKDIYADWPTKVFGGWLSIIFFGGGGLFLILTTLYNKIRHIPLLIIYEDRLELYEQRKGTYRAIHFADVKRFRLIKIHSTKLIAVDYKVTPLIHKVEESSGFMQRLMAFNFKVSGAIESLPADNLTMKGKEICGILNGRLNKDV